MKQRFRSANQPDRSPDCDHRSAYRVERTRTYYCPTCNKYLDKDPGVLVSPSLSDVEAWQLDQAIGDAIEAPRPESQIAVLAALYRRLTGEVAPTIQLRSPPE